MIDEVIIKNEANEFNYLKIEHSRKEYASDIFHELKIRLNDFYSDESKAIFLNEIEKLLIKNLKNHRDHSHAGKADPNCSIETKTEKLLFYIKQELHSLPTIVRQKYSKQGIKKESVFISYSHIDKAFLKEIQRHFKPFKNEIEYFDDSKIQPGSRWKDEIQMAIKKSRVAILIVSTDFLGSEFIANNELPPILESAEKEGSIILTIILKPCAFEEFDQLSQFQTLNPPDRPVSKMDVNEKEELLVNLVRQTRKMLRISTSGSS